MRIRLLLRPHPPYDGEALGRLCAQAIKAAVEAEREACAEIAWDHYHFIGDEADHLSEQIEREIRERALASTPSEQDSGL